MPRFSLGDAGAARWLLSHRWTDTSLSWQVRHTIAAIKAARCRFCVEPPLRVRPTPPCCGEFTTNNLQQALNPCSRTQRAAADVSPACCTSLVLCLCVMLRVLYPLNPLRAFVACAAAIQTAVLVLFGPSCLGHYRPLQRRSASDKCSVRCRLIKTDGQNLPQLLVKTYLR